LLALQDIFNDSLDHRNSTRDNTSSSAACFEITYSHWW